MSAALLARLNARGVDFDNEIPTTGDKLTWEIVAAALSGLPRGSYLLARFLWCQDLSVVNELYALLFREIYLIAVQNKWNCKNQRLGNLVSLAIKKLQQINLCKRCNGTGTKTCAPCEHCDGKGKRRLRQSDLAKSCGVKPSNWQRSWANKYDKIYIIVQEWNEEALTKLVHLTA